MPDALVRVVCTFKHKTGLPDDSVTNVFHFVGAPGATDDENAEACGQAVYGFWLGTVPGMMWSPSGYLATCIDRVGTPARILAYTTNDLTGATDFGSPKYVFDFAPDAPAGAGDFPAEVAVVLSIAGDTTDVPETQAGPPPTRPAARRRGRLYIGPLMGGESSEMNASNEVFVSEQLRHDLLLGANNMWGDVQVDSGCVWAVWSKEDAELYPVIKGHVDNAFDTQRRRGISATDRESLVFA